MSDDSVRTCRDLEELEEDCCSVCHDDTETGHDRMEMSRLDDARRVRSATRRRRCFGRGGS